MRQIHAYQAILALLLTVTFAGCRQEPLPEAGDVIRFSVSSPTLSMETKANLEGFDNLKSGVKLYGNMAGATSLVFDGTTTLSYSTTDSKWSYGAAKYWDQDGVYDFRAVYPTTATATYYPSKNPAEIQVSYAMQKTEGTVTTRTDCDLMVASAPSVSANTQIDNNNPDVELYFHHACAAVRFLFQKGPATTGTPTDYDYTIKSFELQNLYASGTLTYTNVAKDATLSTGWSPATTRTASVFPWTGEWPVPTAFAPIVVDSSDNGWYFVVPQALPSGAAIHFTYVIVGHDTPAEVFEVTLPINTYGGESVTWDPAKQYTYKIKIQPDFIGLEVSYVKWQEGGSWDLTK